MMQRKNNDGNLICNGALKWIKWDFGAITSYINFSKWWHWQKLHCCRHHQLQITTRRSWDQLVFFIHVLSFYHCSSVSPSALPALPTITWQYWFHTSCSHVLSCNQKMKMCHKEQISAFSEADCSIFTLSVDCWLSLLLLFVILLSRLTLTSSRGDPSPPLLNMFLVSRFTFRDLHCFLRLLIYNLHNKMFPKLFTSFVLKMGSIWIFY